MKPTVSVLIPILVTTVAVANAAQGCAKPILTRIETRAGHGASSPTAKLIGDATDRLAFLTKAPGMPTPAF